MFFLIKKIQKNDYVSAFPSSIYRNGGFYDEPDFLDRLITLEGLHGIEKIAELFAPFTYIRPLPDSLLENSLLQVEGQSFSSLLIKYYENLNNKYNKGGACILVEIKDVLLSRNILYLKRSKEFKILYESHRPPDRPSTKVLSPLANRFRRFKNLEQVNRVNLYIGSVGSSNYGHWLVDDLPKLKALDFLREKYPNKEIDIFIPESGEAMQEVKRQSISKLTKHQGIFIRFFQPKNLLWFDSLYYVTPNTYHPSLKSPNSIQFIRNSLVMKPSDLQQYRKIFVMRSAKRGRTLLNSDIVKNYLDRSGFVPVDPDNMQLQEQIAVFSSAKVVIGIMGAAMTNTLFCAPNTDVIYLAPQGWVEPFYWDLANVARQRYHVIYGVNKTHNSKPHESSFEISIDLIKKLLIKIH